MGGRKSTDFRLLEYGSDSVLCSWEVGFDSGRSSIILSKVFVSSFLRWYKLGLEVCNYGDILSSISVLWLSKDSNGMTRWFTRPK